MCERFALTEEISGHSVEKKNLLVFQGGSCVKSS